MKGKYFLTLLKTYVAGKQRTLTKIYKPHMPNHYRNSWIRP